MRLNFAVSLLVILWCVSGCSLDEVLSLDVNKKESVCADVKALQLYEFEDGSVKSRSYCSADQKCAQTNNDYRGALEYGICPEDVPFCLEGDIGNYCGACREGYVVCGRDVNNSVKCIDPKTDKEHCGAKGLCNNGDSTSQHFRGLECDKHEKCVDGACVLEEGYCDPKVKYPFCDGNKEVHCDEKKGTISRTDCKPDEVCDAGKCKQPKCVDVGIKDKTCSEDGRTYYTCDEEGRVKADPFKELECRPGEGCKPKCDKNVCYEDKDKAGILRVCKDGQLVDEPCPEDLFCNSGRCKCNVGDQQCHVRKAGEDGHGKENNLDVKEGELGVRECVYESDRDRFEWKYIEVCDSDRPQCDHDKYGYYSNSAGTEHFVCTDGKHDIGSPCQIIVKDDVGNDHICESGNTEDKLCTDTITGEVAAEFVDQSVQETLSYLPIMNPMLWENAMSSMRSIDHFVDYTNNIFPKDASVIRGCENVVVPKGMQLGCMTSQAMIVMKKYGTFKIFLDLAFEGSGSKDWINKFLGMLEENENQHGIQFTAPHGYCFVGTYDLTLSGWYFNLFFAHRKEDGTLYAAMLHENPEKKVHGLVDMADTVPRHPEGAAAVAAGKCPEGSIGLSYTDPLSYMTGKRYVNGKENPAVDAVDFIGRIGFDVCLKACKDEENSTDCRAGYQCMRLPSVAPCAYESIEEVIARGDYKTACMSKETYDMIVGLRNLNYWDGDEANRPKPEDDVCRDGLCCGSLERDWVKENVSCDRIFEDGDAVCIPQ